MLCRLRVPRQVAPRGRPFPWLRRPRLFDLCLPFQRLKCRCHCLADWFGSGSQRFSRATTELREVRLLALRVASGEGACVSSPTDCLLGYEWALKGGARLWRRSTGGDQVQTTDILPSLQASCKQSLARGTSSCLCWASFPQHRVATAVRISKGGRRSLRSLSAVPRVSAQPAFHCR